MRSVNTKKAAERVTPFMAPILEISSKTGETLYVVHLAADDQITVFRPGSYRSDQPCISVSDLEEHLDPSGL